MIPPISADCSKAPSECRRHNIGLRGGWAHPTSNCVPCGFVSPNSRARQLLRDNGWKLQIVKRRQRAFKITGPTWIVERSFAWLGHNRRFSKDYEYAVQTSETMIDIAS